MIAMCIRAWSVVNGQLYVSHVVMALVDIWPLQITLENLEKYREKEKNHVR